MLSFFLNPILLLGLAGIALPVVAHLLSRRKYDVVEWGAMQFLDLSRKTRRKMKLEELLLLLVRIAAIALIAFAVARPWFSSGFLSGYKSAGSRDIVLVIDGSNSMSRSDGMTTLHEKAKRRAIAFLDTLQPGDTASVIDARDQSVRVISSPLQDLETVAKAISKIPDARGASHLQSACEDAVGILGRCSNGNREIIVLTDRQRVGWNVGSDASWKRFGELLEFPAVKPSVWVVDISSDSTDVTRNVAVGRLNLSRDLTVPDFPVQFEAKVCNTGTTKVEVPLSVLVNGQKLAAMESRVEIGPHSEVTFSRSVPISSEGTSVITVQTALDADSIPADNSSSAALRVRSAIPVLLVGSSPKVAGPSPDTFLAQIALSPSENKTPWFQATSVRAEDVTPEMLQQTSAIVLANVDKMPVAALAALKAEVAGGKGLLVSLGDRTTPEGFEQLYGQSGLLTGIALDRIRSADPNLDSPNSISQSSLEVHWLQRFRERKGASFQEAGFKKWWLLNSAAPNSETTSSTTDGDAHGTVAKGSIAKETATESRDAKDNEASVADQRHSGESSGSKATALQAIALLDTGDPLLLQGRFGRGAVLLMTSSLNVSWNQLPANNDYVPFLHEALFQMASSRVIRNVEFGDPLFAVIPEDRLGGSDRTGFVDPSDDFVEAIGQVENDEATLRYKSTSLPGIYQVTSNPEGGDVLDSFVVNYDHSEHDPENLTKEDKKRLTVDDRLIFASSIEELSQKLYGDESRSELWGLLLWVFLGLLVFEVWMTRRMIQQGYSDTGQSEPASV